ncbi:hypothetical protein L6452_05870 [Arctium lappa]|uniref:Uncharacterized protein n=1 Tax=Arctium lappa TaxID=4217 RepID=A0ACB9EHU8_ARCLA|nr:hypothetical protein L6452_05870 [Arctium lappa]
MLSLLDENSPTLVSHIRNHPFHGGKCSLFNARLSIRDSKKLFSPKVCVHEPMLKFQSIPASNARDLIEAFTSNKPELQAIRAFISTHEAKSESHAQFLEHIRKLVDERLASSASASIS